MSIHQRRSAYILFRFGCVTAARKWVEGSSERNEFFYWAALCHQHIPTKNSLKWKPCKACKFANGRNSSVDGHQQNSCLRNNTGFENNKVRSVIYSTNKAVVKFN